MQSASFDIKIIEHFLATSADYLGVDMHEQRANNFDSPLTAFTPTKFSSTRQGNLMPPQHGEMDSAQALVCDAPYNYRVCVKEEVLATRESLHRRR